MVDEGKAGYAMIRYGGDCFVTERTTTDQRLCFARGRTYGVGQTLTGNKPTEHSARLWGQQLRILATAENLSKYADGTYQNEQAILDLFERAFTAEIDGALNKHLGLLQTRSKAAKKRGRRNAGSCV